MLQVIAMLIPRATEKGEPTVSAFMMIDDWLYYCMDAEVIWMLFVDKIGLLYVVVMMVKYDIYVGA